MRRWIDSTLFFQTVPRRSGSAPRPHPRTLRIHEKKPLAVNSHRLHNPARARGIDPKAVAGLHAEVRLTQAFPGRSILSEKIDMEVHRSYCSWARHRWSMSFTACLTRSIESASIRSVDLHRSALDPIHTRRTARQVRPLDQHLALLRQRDAR